MESANVRPSAAPAERKERALDLALPLLVGTSRSELWLGGCERESDVLRLWCVRNGELIDQPPLCVALSARVTALHAVERDAVWFGFASGALEQWRNVAGQWSRWTTGAAPSDASTGESAALDALVASPGAVSY